MMRKLILWTVLGVVAILFVGPVLAVVATLLPFVAIGFLIWLPVHLLNSGRRSRAWPYLEQARDRCVRAAEVVGSASAAAVRDGYRVGASARAVGRKLGAFLLEVLSGAAVGALVALLSEPEHGPSCPVILVGALLGGMVGILVALARLRTLPAARSCSSI